MNAEICVDDNQDGCLGRRDHVGRVKGTTGRCKEEFNQNIEKRDLNSDLDQHQQSSTTNICNYKESRSCVECTSHKGCAWCLKAGSCVDDTENDVCSGADDHVGRLEGTTGRCGTVVLPAAGEEVQQKDKKVKVTGPPTPCNTNPKAQLSCDACLSMPKCAWCLNENKCVNDIEGACDSREDHIGGSLKKSCPRRVDMLENSVVEKLFRN